MPFCTQRALAQAQAARPSSLMVARSSRHPAGYVVLDDGVAVTFTRGPRDAAAQPLWQFACSCGQLATETPDPVAGLPVVAACTHVVAVYARLLRDAAAISQALRQPLRAYLTQLGGQGYQLGDDLDTLIEYAGVGLAPERPGATAADEAVVCYGMTTADRRHPVEPGIWYAIEPELVATGWASRDEALAYLLACGFVRTRWALAAAPAGFSLGPAQPLPDVIATLTS